MRRSEPKTAAAPPGRSPRYHARMPPGPEAWHEAGHALAAHLLGGLVREVSLESDFADHDGHVVVEWSSLSADELARCSATVALAGPVAELIFQGEGVLEDPEALSAWRADWDEAEAQLERLHANPKARDKARLEILAELRIHFDDLRTHEALARVADALDAHETLDEALFAELV